MKLFVLAPKEDWICDRLVNEFTHHYRDICVEKPKDADVIWLLAGWCWNHLSVDLLKNKKIIVTEHHIVPEKFTQQKLNSFLVRDQFVDCYHVPNEKTASILKQLTNKKIKVISYWLNDNLWYPIDQRESRKDLCLDNNKFYVGSFQRDTEGHDLSTPKLEKGPDIFCDYLIRHKDKLNNLHVLLGGWRRQYVQKRLESSNISYTLFEKADIETVKKLYSSLDLYIVSSRHEGGPQAVIEASAMKIPIISTDVGISSSILTQKCILNLSKDFYVPTQKDVQANYEKVLNFKLSVHGEKFIKLFEEIK